MQFWDFIRGKSGKKQNFVFLKYWEPCNTHFIDKYNKHCSLIACKQDPNTHFFFILCDWLEEWKCQFNKKFIIFQKISGQELLNALLWCFCFKHGLCLFFVNVLTFILPTDRPKPVNLDGPGEMGKPVIIEPENKAESDRLFKINEFNLMASDRISLNRSLPDVRPRG